MKMPSFFVIGSVKSGTTWLSECLNYHPDVVCYNELMLLTAFKDGLTNLFSQENMVLHYQKENTLKEFSYYVPEFTLNDVEDVLNKVWDNIINNTPKKAKVYGEKCPDYSDRLESIIQLYPEAKIVHIVRDPRDCIVSWYYHSKREKRFADKEETYRNLATPLYFDREKESIMMDNLTQWKRQQTVIETVKLRFPEKFYTLKYEEMSAETLDGVFKHIGVKSSIDLTQQIIAITDVNIRPKSSDTFFKFGKSGNWISLGEEFKTYINSALNYWINFYHYT